MEDNEGVVAGLCAQRGYRRDKTLWMLMEFATGKDGEVVFV